MHKHILITLALLTLALSHPADAASSSRRSPERAAAAAERRGDLAAALLQYENLYDSTPTDEAARARLRAKFIELRPKVAPNTDPAKAGVWKVRAYAFRTVDVITKDKDGKEHRAHHVFRADEIEAIRAAMKGCVDEIWKNTSGNLRMEWDLRIIDEPLTRWSGWPDPWNCIPHFKDLKDGEVDSIFVFAKSVRSDPKKDPPTEDLKWSLWAGTFGVLPETKGATYIGFNSPGPASGILQYHEWLHAAQWTLEAHQGYPSGLMITSDCGGNCGTINGRPCYDGPRPDPKEEWMPLYRHLAIAHATRKMWRELSVRNRPDNVWINQYCRKALAIGPFPAAGKPDLGLTTPFIAETTAAPATTQPIAGRSWREITAAGRQFDLARAMAGSGDDVAYLAVCVRSPKEQLAQLRIGSDDGCAVWHDGRPILSAPIPRAAQPDQNIVDLRLKSGPNLFLIKVGNSGGGWEALFRFTDLQGNPLRDIQYTLPGQ